MEANYPLAPSQWGSEHAAAVSPHETPGGFHFLRRRQAPPRGGKLLLERGFKFLENQIFFNKKIPGCPFEEPTRENRKQAAKSAVCRSGFRASVSELQEVTSREGS